MYQNIVLGDRPIRREKSLRVPWGFKPQHASFPLPRGLVRVLDAVVEVPMLAVLDPRQNLPLGRVNRDEHCILIRKGQLVGVKKGDILAQNHIIAQMFGLVA